MSLKWARKRVIDGLRLKRKDRKVKEILSGSLRCKQELCV